jgi:protein tyrosine phosphatase
MKMNKIIFPFIKHSRHRMFEYNQIDDYIFIGTNMCCQTHFEDKLIKIGVTADISLEGERLDAPYGVKFFFWLPTKDHTPPTYEQLTVGVDIINSLIKNKQKIYVHCKNGHGRAPTLVCAYYISKGESFNKAIKKVQEKRPSIHLEESQIQALRIFAEKFRYF